MKQALVKKGVERKLETLFFIYRIRLEKIDRKWFVEGGYF